MFLLLAALGIFLITSLYIWKKPTDQEMLERIREDLNKRGR